MARPEYFRRNAETCLANALQSTSAGERAEWLTRAERWLQLAHEAEAKADDDPLTPGKPTPLDQPLQMGNEAAIEGGGSSPPSAEM
jgi:hypothetical protein